MECGELSRTEVDGLDRGVIINIDHHIGNAMYGDYNWHDDTAAACCEQVYDLIKELNVPLTPEIAIGLYAGILTDTGSFRHANITPRTFDVCRHVAAAGVIVADVAAAVYQNSSIGKIKLTGALLDRMQLECDDRVVILRVDDALMQKNRLRPGRYGGLDQSATLCEKCSGSHHDPNRDSEYTCKFTFQSEHRRQTSSRFLWRWWTP